MGRCSTTSAVDIEDLELWDQVPDITRIVCVLAEEYPEIEHRIPYAALDSMLGLEDVVRRLSKTWGVPERDATLLVAHAMFPLLQELRIWATTQSLGTTREEGEA